MIKDAIATAATRDEAIQKAKAALNAPADADVKFEILQEAQKKVLGLFGGKEAKVRAYYESAEAVKPAVNTAANIATPAANVKKPAVETNISKSNDVTSDKAKDEDAIKQYITVILKGMGIDDITVTCHEEEGETVYELNTTENHGGIIGHHGETLDAVQYLVRLFANKHTNGSSKVSINIGDYREKRNTSLREFAARSAERVLKYGRNVKLDPMNPYERRIIHTAIQEIPGVTSHSVGYDSERRVIITLEDGVQPTHGDRRRYYNNNNRKGGYNNNRNGRPNGGKRDNYRPNVSSTRTPKSDSAGSRYGKIEVKKTND